MSQEHRAGLVYRFSTHEICYVPHRAAPPSHDTFIIGSPPARGIRANPDAFMAGDHQSPPVFIIDPFRDPQANADAFRAAFEEALDRGVPLSIEGVEPPGWDWNHVSSVLDDFFRTLDAADRVKDGLIRWVSFHGLEGLGDEPLRRYPVGFRWRWGIILFMHLCYKHPRWWECIQAPRLQAYWVELMEKVASYVRWCEHVLPYVQWIQVALQIPPGWHIHWLQSWLRTPQEAPFFWLKREFKPSNWLEWDVWVCWGELVERGHPFGSLQGRYRDYRRRRLETQEGWQEWWRDRLRPLNQIIGDYQGRINSLLWQVLPSWFVGTADGDICMLRHLLKRQNLAAYRLAMQLKPALASPEARRRLQELARQQQPAVQPEMLLYSWLFPEGLRLAVAEEDTPRRIRIGRQWKKKDDQVARDLVPSQLSHAEYKIVLLQEAYKSAEATLLDRPYPHQHRDALDGIREGQLQDDVHRFSPEAIILIQDCLSDLASTLTSREREILELLSNDCSPSEIAMHLKISRSTVDVHIFNLKKKLSSLLAS